MMTYLLYALVAGICFALGRMSVHLQQARDDLSLDEIYPAQLKRDHERLQGMTDALEEIKEAWSLVEAINLAYGALHEYGDTHSLELTAGETAGAPDDGVEYFGTRRRK